MGWLSNLFGLSQAELAVPSQLGAADLRRAASEQKTSGNWVAAYALAGDGPAPSGSEGRGPAFTSLGTLESKCASCGAEFAKRPERKAKCPACCEYNFVRKRPLDDLRVLLREDEIIELERQRAWSRGDGATFDAQLERYAIKQANLDTQFGRRAPAADVRWGLLNEDLLELSRRRDWISVRQTYQTMAQNLEAEGKHKQAAVFFMVVFCYDVNGASRPDTSFNWTDRDVQEFSHDPRLDFDPTRAFDSPARVVGGIIENLEKAGISSVAAEELFIEEASKFINERMPIKSEAVWAKWVEITKAN